MRNIFLFTCVFLVLTASSTYAVSYKIHDLGGPGTEAEAINNKNQTVGYSMVDRHAVATLWDTNGRTYLTDPAETISIAMGINNNGMVVGGVRPINTSNTDVWFRWQGGNLMQLPVSGGAVDVNDNGQIIGGGYFWSQTTGVLPLSSAANCINNSGQMAGQGMFWNSPTQVMSMGFSTGQIVDARGINDNGQVVGFYCVPGQLDEAFIWDSANGTRDLGVVGGADDINNRGEVVGTDNTYHAFYWYNDNFIQLESLAPDALSRAYSINDSGWIAGKAWDAQGNLHAVLWEPVPEPSAVIALLFGIAGLGVPALRKRLG